MKPGAGVWRSGAAYEPYVGRWSRLVANAFLDWLGLPAGRRWLDVGCGTGALTAAILERCDPREVIGIDPSDAYIAYAVSRIQKDRVRFQVADAAQLPEGPFDAVVSGLALNFFPDLAVLQAMREISPNGTVAAYVWDYSRDMQMLRFFWDAAVLLDSAATDWDEGVRFSICRPDRLESVWLDAGFIDVISRSIDVPTVFQDFDDYWQPFLSGEGPAPSYAMSLSEERRSALRECIRGSLPMAPDGSISLTARAWAIRGRVPTG